MRFVVTGARGFLGTHLCRRLAPDGDVAKLEGDVRDPRAFDALGTADVAFHLAAVASPAASLADPRAAWDVNATGTLNMLEWARRERVKRVVVVSSAHVYGIARESPISEEHPRAPVTPYGASKLAAEALAGAYAAAYGLETVIVRPFNVYGPGQAPGFLVPDIFAQIREGKSLVLGNPAPVRDFVYVEDAIDLLVKAGRVKGAAGATLNLGSGAGHSVDDVARAAVRVSGSTLVPRYDPARFRANEIHELIVDNRRARETLGWAPRVPLDEGLARTWEAMRA